MTKALQVRTRTPFDIVSANLSDLFSLPDAEAAEALNGRMAAFVQIERIHQRSYVERGLIIREFEKRKLWKYLTDPETGETFPHLTAWLSCSEFLGCRRTNFESKRDMELLVDISAEKLIDVPKSNIKVLTQLSTAVRNQPDVLEAARTLPQHELMDKVEQEHPLQHIEKCMPIRLTPGRSERKAIDKWVNYALEHDIAGSPTEAVVRACEMAMHDAELEEELAAMPTIEARE